MGTMMREARERTPKRYLGMERKGALLKEPLLERMEGRRESC